MSSYNRTKKADRAAEIAARKAEIAAVDEGKWPRDLNDEYRWLNAPTNGFLTAAENNKIRAEYARQMCQDDVTYLEGISARVQAGELPGWEA